MYIIPTSCVCGDFSCAFLCLARLDSRPLPRFVTTAVAIVGDETLIFMRTLHFSQRNTFIRVSFSLSLSLSSYAGICNVCVAKIYMYIYSCWSHKCCDCFFDTCSCVRYRGAPNFPGAHKGRREGEISIARTIDHDLIWRTDTGFTSAGNGMTGETRGGASVYIV